MTYVEGVSFDRALDALAGSDVASLSASETLELAGKLVEPFLAMERAGVAHGDLHASNVRIAVEAVGRPSVARVGLIDFGNARQSDAAGRSLYTPTPTVKRKMPGSFWFESPESFSCDACPHNEGARSKPSSNMWAFGALLYYAYYRHLPHDGAARAYSSVWGSETVSEKGRASALRAFIEAKTVPLELPMSPGDNEDSFRMLSDLIRNTMVDDPSRRWTAQLCKRRVEEFSEKRVAESCDSPRPHQLFSTEGGRRGAGGQVAVSKGALPDDPGSESGRQAGDGKASKAGSLVRAGFVWAFAHLGISDARPLWEADIGGETDLRRTAPKPLHGAARLPNGGTRQLRANWAFYTREGSAWRATTQRLPNCTPKRRAGLRRGFAQPGSFALQGPWRRAKRPVGRRAVERRRRAGRRCGPVLPWLSVRQGPRCCEGSCQSGRMVRQGSRSGTRCSPVQPGASAL